MADKLISREAAESALDEIIRAYIAEKSYTGNFAAGVVCDIRDNVIAELPSVDAVEVVRCENCKHWDTKTHPQWLATDCGECAKHKKYIKHKTDFCSCGERKEDNA